jgi:hypothetical protein
MHQPLTSFSWPTAKILPPPCTPIMKNLLLLASIFAIINLGAFSQSYQAIIKQYIETEQTEIKDKLAQYIASIQQKLQGTAPLGNEQKLELDSLLSKRGTLINKIRQISLRDALLQVLNQENKVIALSSLDHLREALQAVSHNKTSSQLLLELEKDLTLVDKQIETIVNPEEKISFARQLLSEICPKLEVFDIRPLVGKIYSVFDTFGDLADIVFARGNLSPQNQKLFEELAAKLHLEHRNIKAKNAGIFMRILMGYQHTFAIQELNRVYFNDDVLDEYSQDARKFAIAHGLSYHHNNRSWKLLLVKALLLDIKKIVINKAIAMGFIILTPNPLHLSPKNFLISYLTLSPYFLNVWELLLAQYDQQQEMQADATVVTTAGLNPASGKDFLYQLTYPTTDTWPLYAQIENLALSLLRPIRSLPIIRNHIKHHQSNSFLYEARIAQFDNLQDKWQREHDNTNNDTHHSTNDK